MINEPKCNEQELSEELLNWFWTNKDKIKNNKRFWTQTDIGYALSSIMKELDRWKNAPRGKPFKENKTLTHANEIDLDF